MHSRHLYMPFGLTSALAVFQNLFNNILLDMLKRFIFVYLEFSKVLEVTDWPVPESRKHLQCFLGFSNFYSLLIRDYCLVVAHLTQLTSIKLPYLWSPEADLAFGWLKTLLPSSLPPGPKPPDRDGGGASDTGVRVISAFAS